MVKIIKHFFYFFSFFLILILFCGAIGIVYAGSDIATPERIKYRIKPLGGSAEFTNFGLVDLDGKKVNKSTFRTQVLGFKDTETIYSLEQSLLPVRVERDIRRLVGEEYIIEEYDQVNFKLTVTKYRGKRKVSELTVKTKGPIHNAVFLIFCASEVSGLKLGWSKVFLVPNKFEVTLSSIDKIKIRDKTYMACHFTSQPDKFEFWVDQNEPHIPLKIKGKGDFKYTFSLREYIPAVIK